jgi:hypothetical protein
MPENGTPIPDVVEARRFVLRGEDGSVKAELSTDENDEPRLMLIDSAGVPRVGIRLEGDLPVIQIFGADGTIRAGLGPDEDGTVAFSLSDEAGKSQLVLGVLHSGGGPNIVLTDEDGEARVFITLVEGPHIKVDGKRWPPKR